jgi:hypothetical protein
VNDFPRGYPLQAAFQSSEPSFSIYRTFGYLHARVILQLQDELRALEDALLELDADDKYSDDPRQRARVTSRDVDMEEARLAQERSNTQVNASNNDATNSDASNNDATNSDAPKNDAPKNDAPNPTTVSQRWIEPVSERAALLELIRINLLKYDEMLVKGRELAEFQRPSDRDYLTFRTWFWNTKPLSYEREMDFIQRKGDLITLRPRAEWGKFDEWMKARISTMPSFLKKVSHHV